MSGLSVFLKFNRRRFIMRFLMMFFLGFILFAGNVSASEPASAEPAKSSGQAAVKENADNSAAQGKAAAAAGETDEAVGVLSEPVPEFKK